MKSLLAVAALLVAATPLSATAQSPGVDGTRLQAGIERMTIFFVQGTDTSETGSVIDGLAVDTVAGQRVWRRTYSTHDQLLGTRRDSVMDRQADLLPVRHRSESSLGTEAFEFASDEAQGWRRPPGGDSIAIARTLPQGTINAGSFDLYLRAAALGPDYQLSIPAFITTTGVVITLTARVVGEEQVAGVECWRVEADFAGMPVTFWVAKDDRAMQQQVMQLQPGIALLFRRIMPT